MHKTYLILLILIVANASNAQNNGWLMPQKGLKLITYYGRYSADSFKDNKGNSSSYTNEGKFSSDYFKVSAEYGLANNVNLYASLPLIYNVQTSSIEQNDRFDFGDSELGVITNLKKWERSYLVGTLNVGIPLYPKRGTPSIGLGEYSSAASLKYCGSIDAGYKFFFSIEQGVRIYFDGTLWWSNSAQLGYNISKQHSLIAEISGMKSFDNGAFNTSPDANRAAFFYEKVALGYYYKVTKKIQLGGTLWSDVINRNSSVGKGFSAIAILTL